MPVLRSLCLLLVSFAIMVVPASAGDFRDGFPQIMTMSPHGVNLQTGRFEMSDTDLSIGTLSVQRRYSSRGFGPASSPASTVHGHEESALFAIGHNLRGVQYRFAVQTFGGGSDTRTYFHVGGQRLEFTTTQNGYVNWGHETRGWRVIPQGNDLVLLHRSGTTYRFVPHAALGSGNAARRVLSEVINPNGERWTYTYGAAGELFSVHSNLGYRVNFQYDNATNIAWACGYNLAVAHATATQGCSASTYKTRYAFAGSAGTYSHLTSVTHVDGTVTTLNYITHYSANLLSCVTFPNSSTCRVTNEYWPLPGDLNVSLGEKPDMVRRQTLATGEVWMYHYDLSQFAGDAPPLGPRDLLQGNERYTYGFMIDPMGRSTQVTFMSGIVRSVLGPTGETRYNYFGLEPTTVIAPEGNEIIFAYDDNGNNVWQTQKPKPGSPESQITASQTFPTAVPVWATGATTLCTAASQVLCDKPISRTDARGNVTDYTYDATHGGVLTETLPPVTAPNGATVRPQTRSSYVQRTAMVRDASGNIVAAGPPIWLLASTSNCREGAASGSGCATAGDEIVTTFDYGPTTGPNNLLLRGQVVDAGGLALRTCYTYDALGNRISETQPEGTSAGTPCP